MYKSKLQELCQKRSWDLPVYEAPKEGLDHSPRFTGIVRVNGLTFETAKNACRSSKQAQNEVALLALQYFQNNALSQPTVASSASGSSFPACSADMSIAERSLHSEIPSANQNSVLDKTVLTESSLTPTSSAEVSASKGFLHSEISSADQSSQIDNGALPTGCKLNYSLTTTSSADTSAAEGSLHPEITSANQNAVVNKTVLTTEQNLNRIESMYKNKLQSYAHKKGLDLPMYSSTSEGPFHARRFKATVTIHGQTYESPEFYSTLKDAEHGAAKSALMSLLPFGTEEDEPGLYKNLLQEFAHKHSIQLPVYVTSKSGEDHSPIFVSTVEVQGQAFTGQEAKSKKQAEINAARVAYNALKAVGSQASMRFTTFTAETARDRGSQASMRSTTLPMEFTKDIGSQVSMRSAPFPTETAKDAGVGSQASVRSTTFSTEAAKGTELSQSTYQLSVVHPVESTSKVDANTGSSSSVLGVNALQKVQSTHMPVVEKHIDAPLPSYSEKRLDGMESSPCTRVIVFPRSQNMNIGGTILPISNDKFMAVKILQ